MPENIEPLPSTATGLSRRDAVKAAAAVGVGAVVWAEPTVKGLVRRPAYAASGSADTNHDVMITGELDASGNVTNLSVVPASVGGILIVLTPQPQNASPTNRLRLEENDGVQNLKFNSAVTPTWDLAVGNLTFSNNGLRLLFGLEGVDPVTLAGAAGIFTVMVQITCLASP